MNALFHKLHRIRRYAAVAVGLLTVVATMPAEAQTAPPPIQPLVVGATATRTGHLQIQWGDPPTSRTAVGRMEVQLVGAAGAHTNLTIPDAVAASYGGVHNLDRKNVTVTGKVIEPEVPASNGASP